MLGGFVAVGVGADEPGVAVTVMVEDGSEPGVVVPGAGARPLKVV